jgi:Plastocyanin
MRDTRPYGSLSVKVGTEVTWTSACFALCSITFKSGDIDSGPMVKGDTFKHAFSVPGSCPYYCQFDPAEMTGTIIVTN